MTRPDTLPGATYCATLDNGQPLFVTINSDESGNPCEVFVRMDNPELFEWVTLVTVLITRLLRAGQQLDTIANELQEIHSPSSRHFIPGGGGECPSLAARIGMMLAAHTERAKEAA
jgi:hypothetical protein